MTLFRFQCLNSVYLGTHSATADGCREVVMDVMNNHCTHKINKYVDFSLNYTFTRV